MSSAYAVGKIEAKAIFDLLGNIWPERPSPGYKNVPKEADEVASTYAKINPLLNDDHLHDTLHQECMYS